MLRPLQLKIYLLHAEALFWPYNITSDKTFEEGGPSVIGVFEEALYLPIYLQYLKIHESRQFHEV